ncbi:response regulator [candidate division KSB1 bacterium]|nr:response regulator [candidate division KSB1 bacterium]
MSINKILIVDDEENIRNLLESFLNKQGFETAVAKNGDDALHIIRKQQIDLTFLDVKLPGKDGVEILKAIKDTTPDITVIMISGHATVQTAEQTLKIGAFDYIKKPLNLEKVEEIICYVDLLHSNE